MTTGELALTFLLNAAWQLPAVVLLGTLGSLTLRRAPARHRHQLWLAVLLLGLVLPLASVARMGHLPGKLQGASGAALSDVAAPLVPSSTGSASAWTDWLASIGGIGKRLEAAVPARIWDPTLVSGVAAAYGALLFSLAVRLFASCLAVRRLHRASFPLALTPEIGATLDRCRAAFGLGEVELRFSSEIASPVTYGFLRPAILVPERFFHTTSHPEQLAALGHETAHIARRDFVVHLLSEIALLPLAFHPAAWYLRRRLAETREMACDEATIERLLGARAYARSLLSLAALGTGLARPTPTLGVFDAGTLEVRMKSLMDVRSRMGGLRARIQLSLVTLLLALAALVLPGMSVEAVAERPEGAASAGATALASARAKSSAPAEWAPFLGKWIGEVPVEGIVEKDGKVEPVGNGKRPHFADVEIAWVDGAPRAQLVLFRVVRTEKGIAETPIPSQAATEVKLTGRTLAFRLHTDDFRQPDGKVVPADTDWEMEATGPGQGRLRLVRHSYFTPARARGENVPPKPPELELRKAS